MLTIDVHPETDIGDSDELSAAENRDCLVLQAYEAADRGSAMLVIGCDS